MRVSGTEILYIEMIHPESGQFVAGYAELKYGNKDNPRAYGSALTYARRYALSAILGVVSDEDDDETSPPGMVRIAERMTAARRAAAMIDRSAMSAPRAAAGRKVIAGRLRRRMSKTKSRRRPLLLEPDRQDPRQHARKMPLTFVAKAFRGRPRDHQRLRDGAHHRREPDEVLATYAETLSVARPHRPHPRTWASETRSTSAAG